MRADEIERIYRKMVAKGQPEIIQYVSGSTLRRMASMAGKRLDVTTEGHPIQPDEVYSVSVAGIFRID
jgi:hypothetical protein